MQLSDRFMCKPKVHVHVYIFSQKSIIKLCDDSQIKKEPEAHGTQSSHEYTAIGNQ